VLQELQAMMERAARQSTAEQENVTAGSGQPPAAAGSGQPPAAAASAAAASSSQSSSLSLDKDVFWFAAQGKDRFKWNMLTSLPLLRQVNCWHCGLLCLPRM
jgi:hypothetical protein